MISRHNNNSIHDNSSLGRAAPEHGRGGEVRRLPAVPADLRHGLIYIYRERERYIYIERER